MSPPRMIKPIGLVVALLALLVAPHAASAAQPDFTALEDRLSDALARYDAASVADLWDDSFVFVFPNGHVFHKAERLARLTPPTGAAPSTLSSHNDKVDVAYQDADMAVVIVHSAWRSSPAEAGDRYVATHVWVRRGDRWRLVSAQVAHEAP
jgi:ketosteroid isomerase-like protein